MCEGVWALFEGPELHSLWNNREELLQFQRDNKLLEDPEYSVKWIRIED